MLRSSGAKEVSGCVVPCVQASLQGWSWGSWGTAWRSGSGSGSGSGQGYIGSKRVDKG